MDASSTAFRSLLTSHGYSYTHSRRQVFDALARNERQTIAQLVDACPGVDRATIYRTVTLFEKLGIIQRLQQGWKYELELSSRFSHHHHHFTCTVCGQLVVVPEDAALEARLDYLAHEIGFKPVDHQIEVRGICAACLPKLTSAEREPIAMTI